MATITNQLINIPHKYHTHTINGTQFLTLSGTYNGIVTTGATNFVLNGRWSTWRLWDTFDDSIQCQTKLPLNYIPGSTIQIIVNWESTVTTGNCKYNVGIGGIDSGGQWADDPDMTYGTSTLFPAMATSLARNSNTWTFNVTDFIAGEEICIVVYRQSTSGNTTDTLADYMQIVSIQVKYQIDSIASKNNS